MQSLERIVLYVTAAVVAVTLLERARAQDPPAQDPVMAVPQLEIQNAQGVIVIRLSASADGAGQIDLFSKTGRQAVRLYCRKDNDGEIRLFDDKSVLRTAIGANDTGGYANFYTRTGKQGAYIGSDAGVDGGYFALFGPGEKKFVSIYTHKKGGMISTRNMAGKTMAAIGSESGKDGGYLVLYGSNNKKALEAYTHKKSALLVARNTVTDKAIALFGGASDSGVGMLSLSTAKGVRGVLSYATDDGGQIKALNSKGKSVAFLGVSANPAGNGLIYAARDDGQRVFECGRNAGMGGYLSIRNGLGKRVVFIGASAGDTAGEGVIEIARNNGKLGVVARAHLGGSSVRIYDQDEKVIKQLR